jgi:hypothetical protein
MNAKISLVAIAIAVCLSMSASSAPDPELNRPIGSERAKPATLLPALIWNPLFLPSGDSLYQTLLRGNYEANQTSDLTLYLDSLANYHLFIIAGIGEHGDFDLTWAQFQPLYPAILAHLTEGGACYWEGAYAFSLILNSGGSALYDYFRAAADASGGVITYIRGFDYGGPCDDIDSLAYAGTTRTYTIGSSCGLESYVLWGGGAKGVACQVGLTRTMLTNFSWARLNDSGTNSRVDLIDDVMNWLSGAVAIDEPEPLPQTYSLTPPYPNPFNVQTTIEYALPNEAAVSLSVFDIQGRKVATLTEGTRPAGYHRLIWDAKSMPSGLYFMRLKAGEFTETRKMTLVK